MPFMAVVGYVLQRFLLNHTMGGDLLPPLLLTFGLSVIIRNALLMGYSADPQKPVSRPALRKDGERDRFSGVRS
ncbi:branched-subunit amino acid ABC-type transport system permease component [Rhizobium aquaticum]|uniref:Branched-subunit amino acid ABC-type transport system permease component n=1 Tax=Rhizobium aquaticum TaxID=1549636 RepID=A0ABV2J0G8_9HYPH